MAKRSRDTRNYGWFPKIYVILGLSCTGKTMIGMELLSNFNNTVFLEQDDYVTESEKSTTTNISVLSNKTRVPTPITEGTIDWGKLNETVKMYMGYGWNVIIASSFMNISKYIIFRIYKLLILEYGGNERTILKACLRRRKVSYGISVMNEYTDMLTLTELVIPLYNETVNEMINTKNLISLTGCRFLYVTNDKGRDAYKYYFTRNY